MRIALVYDCIFPNTIGGAERWYRNVAEGLDRDHEVTYLTRRQWGEEGPETSFEAVAVAPGGPLYSTSGQRRIDVPLRFGWGVFWHLLRHAGRYDAVHTASFPYFSVLGAKAALMLRRSKAPLIVDWHEFWGEEYWRAYLGPTKGRVGAMVQSLCLRCADLSFTFSRLVEGRLRERGHERPVVRLTGEFAGLEGGSDRADAAEATDQPLAVFAGRHIPEKHVLSIPPAIAAARRQGLDLRCAILGEGPETEELRRLVRGLGLEDAVEVRGRVAAGEVMATISAAACLLNPSEREGYGLVIVEAAALGTPTIVVAGPENAATELIEPGVNGFVAGSHDAEELAGLLVKAVREADRLGASTQAWYEENRRALSLQRSIETIESAYAALATGATEVSAQPGSGASP
jgi:glycosyltransferase involved in cell wall biosynthesis